MNTFCKSQCPNPTHCEQEELLQLLDRVKKLEESIVWPDELDNLDPCISACFMESERLVHMVYQSHDYDVFRYSVCLRKEIQALYDDFGALVNPTPEATETKGEKEAKNGNGTERFNLIGAE